MTILEAKHALRAHIARIGIRGVVGINCGKLVVLVDYQHNLPADQFTGFEGFQVLWKVIAV